MAYMTPRGRAGGGSVRWYTLRKIKQGAHLKLRIRPTIAREPPHISRQRLVKEFISELDGPPENGQIQKRYQGNSESPFWHSVWSGFGHFRTIVGLDLIIEYVTEKRSRKTPSI
jgi:hypothetical protein